MTQNMGKRITITMNVRELYYEATVMTAGTKRFFMNASIRKTKYATGLTMKDRILVANLALVALNIQIQQSTIISRMLNKQDKNQEKHQQGKHSYYGYSWDPAVCSAAVLLL